MKSKIILNLVFVIAFCFFSYQKMFSQCSVPTVKSPIYYCLNSPSSALTATPTSGAKLNWYTSEIGTQPFASAPTPSTTTVGSTTYYVSQTVGSCESARASIVVNVVADTGAIATYFVCSPTEVTTSNSVYFDWNHVSGRSTNDYGYSYSIAGGPLVFGRTPLTSLEVFGVLPGQSVELTILDVPGVPCYPTQSLTCSLACTTTTAPNFATIPAICSGATPVPTLATTSPNAITGSWSPSTIDNTTSQSYVFTPDPTSFPCASKQTLNVTVNSKVTPTFTGIPSSLCQGASAPILPTISSNSITGTWSPSSVDTSIVGTTTYTFTPTAGQCATTTTLTVIVNPKTTPTFAAVPPICQGSISPVLPTTSTNGITGTWSPAFNNTVTATYTFTPTSGQCATTTTLTVTVNPKVTPTFSAIAPICSGGVIISLPTTSFNGITGTWSPALNNTQTTTYTFTPTPGQCATTTTKLTVTVYPKVTPTFAAVPPICSGATITPLPTTSNDGITGTWSPALSNTSSTTYTFTPTSGLCATNTTLTITVNPISKLSLFYCDESLVTTTNSIFFDWAPVSGSTNYNYSYSINGEPNITGSTKLSSYEVLGVSGGQNVTLTIQSVDGAPCFVPTSLTCSLPCKIINSPTFTPIAPICSGTPNVVLPTTSTNGITGTWSPALNNTQTTTYTFTPTPGQCATTATLTIIVNPKTTPTFAAVPPICQGSISPVLSTTSNNGVAGTWLPSTISNSATGVYFFTPDSGQCATTATLTVTVNSLPFLEPMSDVTACSSYTLPELLKGSYYSGVAGTGNLIAPGTVITTSTLLSVFFNDGFCSASYPLSITIIPETKPEIVTENDTHDLYVDNATVVQPLLLDSQFSDEYSFQWYENGILIDGATSSTYFVNTVSQNANPRNFTVTAIKGICESTSSIFEVNQSPVPAPSGNRFQSFTQGQTLADLIVIGSNIQWYADETANRKASSPLPLNTLLVNGTTYYASQTINGFESPSRLAVTVQVALGNHSFAFKDLQISPNPILDVLSIKSKDIVRKVSVYNVLGQEVSHKEGNGLEFKLDLSHLVSGNYFVKVASENKQKVLKVVKK